MKTLDFDLQLRIDKQSTEIQVSHFIPLYIKNVVISNTQGTANIRFVYGEALYKRARSISIEREGIHFCICNLARPRFKLWLECVDKIFTIKKVKREDVLLLVETGWLPNGSGRPLPLGEYCVLELLYQGFVTCNLELAYPLIDIKTITISAESFVNFMENWKPVPTCKISNKMLNYHSLSLLALNIAEKHNHAEQQINGKRRNKIS
jgi:hypothetical protein